MRRGLLAILLVTGSAAAAPPVRGPRLELTVTAKPRPPWAATPDIAAPTHEIALRLVNDGDAPVEADAPMYAIQPDVTDAAGKPVTFLDMRNVAGYAMPQQPPPPGPPVRPGESRLLATFVVAWSEKGSFVGGPYGDAVLAPGRHRVQVALTFVPTTRAGWIAAFREAPATRGKDAEREANRFNAHWKEVPTYWTGHLQSNAVWIDVK